MITGLLTPTSGTVYCLRPTAPPSQNSHRSVTGKLGLFEDLTVHEHLSLTADVFDLAPQLVQERID